MKKALITGALGQDGSYMAEHLLSLGYEVWGTVRKYCPLDSNKDETGNYVKGVYYHYADMRDELSLEKVIRQCHPDEIYNFAGQVFVPTSWEYPAETFDVNTGGLARIFKIVEKVCPSARIYQASSSEMYGNTLAAESGLTLLDELSPMHPVSPYAVSKYAAHCLVQAYRKKGLYVVSGIAFNHESPRRGPEMVTRKISKAFAEASVEGHSKLRLGNTSARRDWGFAGDYVKAMQLMLQQPHPDDYVIGTGKAYSVRDFIHCASLVLEGERYRKLDVEGNCAEFSRSNELYTLIADATKAYTVLGWKPETTFHQLVSMMVNADIERLKCAGTLQQQ